MFEGTLTVVLAVGASLVAVALIVSSFLWALRTMDRDEASKR
jgi:nitrogen fixation-related uncharacterized protein